MPTTKVTETAPVIQKAWNDGLFNLRQRRNGIARGGTIEEKAMYVLGLGWKFASHAEIKDKDIEAELMVSLEGLTQDSKFLKIGQVLWEQCDPQFILRMITSLSNNNREQSRVYQQISLRERQNFKGYFTKASMKSIANNNLNPHNILNREAKQLNTNTRTTARNREQIKALRPKLAQYSINSKKFEKRVVQFKPGSAETRQLAKELRVVLRTYEAQNIGEIAMKLGVEVETGYNKKYLTEEIIGIVCTYVEKELMISGAGVGNATSNVYIRQNVDGFETIKRLLKYTHFGLMVTGDGMSLQELQSLQNQINAVREAMKLGKKKGGGSFSLKRFDRNLNRKDKLLKKVSNAFGNYKPAGMKIRGKNKNAVMNFLIDKLGGDNDPKFTYKKSPGEANPISNIEALSFWINTKEYDIAMASSIIGNNPTGEEDVGKLKFNNLTNDQLLEQLIMLQTSLDIDKTLLSKISADNPLLGPANPGLYLAAVIRKYLLVLREGNRFGILGFTRRRNRKNLISIEDKFETNLATAKKDKKNLDKLFSKGPDGVFSPYSIDPETLRKWAEKGMMQPVYVVGGSIYSFKAGLGFTGSEKKGSASGINWAEAKEKIINRNKVFTSGDRKAIEAIAAASPAGMGAFGTLMPPIDTKDLDGPTSLKMVVEAKMMKELQKKKIKVKPDIQPVFMVNQGINTSNIETTALLNLVPKILSFIPGLGTAVAGAINGVLQSEIDAARALPKFAQGGSFNTVNNSNISQFVTGDSINNRMNPEKVTIDWASQRVNVQPLQNTTNNVTNIQKGRISDPILGTSTTVRVNDKSGKSTEAVNVVNAINPFGESLSTGNINATPMEVLISLKESLVDILNTLSASGQVSQANAQMTAKVADGINALNSTIKNSGGGDGSKIFSPPMTRLARGD